ncbi:MAG: S8 family serine peptidase [Candidatus Competibacteraceae bacterium]|nr:S8 family serine peptidase [Candidatus Competibacteraceae bacterium]
MKKIVLVYALLGMMLQYNAQTAFEHYQDGKIWFKIKNDYRVTSSLNENPRDLPFTHLPFLSSMAKSHALTRLSKPFFAAKDDATLQRTYLLEFSDFNQVSAIIRKLESMQGVEYAEKVPMDKHFLVPNDPSYSSQWAMNKIGAPTAWNYFSTGSNIVIAIVDDAVERTHSDLSPNLWVNPGEIAGNGIDDDNNGYIDDINGYDVGSNDNNPNPPSSSYSHGTHVAGISSARTNNGIGVASIGFSCKLMCVKATNSPTSVTNGYDGIVYAANSGAHIINCSWGGPSYSTTGQNVINYAWNKGCIIIAASGNDNVSSQFYPAAFNNVISVSATSSNDAKASFSNYGSWIDISAPGHNIYSTYVGNTYGNMSGTSMASPMVSGLAGLMWSLNPSMPRADLINCLLTTATNIDAQNPSYIGQLGSGRINAAQAMQCVSTSLNNPPVADFTANFTTVTAGGQVIFTDQSTYNPTTWAWTFTGGTPASFNGQNPPAITYNTPGVYTVTLTTTNANGSDIETKTNYITVNAAGGCYSINFPVPGGWTLVNYITGTGGADGFVNGQNVYADKQKAMFFDASAQPYTYLTKAYIAFGAAYSSNTAKVVPIRIYDGTAGPTGAPGALLATTNLTMGEIMADVNNSYYTVAEFSTPVTLPVSKKFYVSVDVSNLSWAAVPKDSISVVSNTNGQSTGYPIWEQWSDNTWHQYGTAGSWNLNASLIIHPFLTNQPVVATFTQTATSICTGESISFDAAGSTYQDTLLWVFPGGSPFLVPSNPSPTVYFNTPGTHTVKMYVIGGGCSDLDSAQVSITVNPTPAVSISTSNSQICPSQSTVLNATGATSFTWSPSGSLSSSTGSSVTATPSSTTTYYVSGTTGSCTGNSTIEIVVLDLPVASVTNSSTNILCNTSVDFDASASDHASSFAWTFQGGNPATSNASGASVTYNAIGSFTASLTVSNICGADSSFSTLVTVTGDCSSGIEDYVLPHQVFFAPIDRQIVLQFTNAEPFVCSLFNALGQVIMQQKVASTGTQTLRIDASTLAAGMYIVRLDSGTQSHQVKLIVD